MTFLDVDAPNTNWRGTEDPIPVIFGRFPVTGAFYRYITCRPLDGWARTDATFWHAGTKALTRSGKVMPYQFWPGWKRGLLMSRLPPFLGAWSGVGAGIDTLNLDAPWWLDWPVPASLAVPVAGWWTYRGVRYARDYRFNRDYLRPLQGALVNTLRTREGVKLAIPRNLVQATVPGPTGRVFLPPAFVGSDQERDTLVEVCRGRLSSSVLDARFNMEGARPSMELFVPPQPPAMVGRDVMLEHADVTRPHLGMSAYGAIHWDLGESSPHLGVVGGSGSGKSELSGWAVAQLMRGGAGTVVLDPKDTSHRWLMSMPGVLYYGSGQLADGIMAVDNELSRRQEDNARADRDIDFPRLVVLLEERNSMQDTLRQQWADTATADKGGRSSHPAIAALNRITSKGRSLNIIVLLAGQETSTVAIGSRSNFSAWACAGRMGPNHFKTLMGSGGKKPAIAIRPGSFARIEGGEATVFQAAFPDLGGDPDWIREYAMGGVPSWDTTVLMTQQADESMRRSGAGSSGSATAVLVTLGEFARSRGLKLTDLQNWRKRDAEFPAPASTVGSTHRYDETALASYVAGRNGEQS
ncbi:MAG: hypothetical protein JXA67_20405 [Micromonosporaceae bacterium]|nr:hypothetical protein [Micromonosporaceae bacterium]